LPSGENEIKTGVSGENTAHTGVPLFSTFKHNKVNMKKSGTLIFCGILIFSSCHRKNNYPMVTTLAGTGTMGALNGRGTSASFSNLMGVAADDLGNLYVADSRNNMIRKISADGEVTTMAGSGIAGSADGKADTASFFYPEGVAVDRKGNLYVADTHNSLIRMISPDGFVTTLAGQRIYHTIPGMDTVVRFDNPAGIAVDPSGYVYVADCGNDLIRKISPDGKVQIIAGNGKKGAKDSTGLNASFYLPGGIALDSIGNIYVADTYNNKIRKISPAGIVTTLAGRTLAGKANGKRSAASFSHPAGLTVGPGGYIYVADVGNNRIRVISPDGMVTNFAGSGIRGSTDGRDTIASFYRPYGVASDRSGNIYVADYLNNLVRKISF
jgi:sugar lactone lactonase YvrE